MGDPLWVGELAFSPVFPQWVQLPALTKMETEMT